MSKPRIDGWVVDSGLSASRRTNGKNVEVEIDGDDLEVRVDEGRGYNALNTTAWIPLDILRTLMAPPLPGEESK